MSHPQQYAEASSSQLPPSQSVYTNRFGDYNFSTLDDNINIQPLTPGQSISQRNLTSTPASIPDIDLLTPIPLPPTLERVGRDTQKVWVLYTEMNKTQFIEWWRHTAGAFPQPPRRKVNFEANYTSPVWDNFDQVAHYITGQPMALCRRCGKAIPHPSQAGGLNSLKRHRDSKTCEKGGRNTSIQQTLQQSLQFAVKCSLLYRF